MSKNKNQCKRCGDTNAKVFPAFEPDELLCDECVNEIVRDEGDDDGEGLM